MEGRPGRLSAASLSHGGPLPYRLGTCHSGGPPLPKGWEPWSLEGGPGAGPWTLTTKRLLTLSRICFSLSAMDSPFLFLILFFSKRLQAYIFPVARTWQAQT